MIFFTVVWLILIQPNKGAMPGASELRGLYSEEFRAEQVEFANQDDCEYYAKKHLGDLLTLKKKGGKSVNFPDDAVPTYTCASADR